MLSVLATHLGLTFGWRQWLGSADGRSPVAIPLPYVLDRAQGLSSACAEGACLLGLDGLFGTKVYDRLSPAELDYLYDIIVVPANPTTSDICLTIWLKLHVHLEVRGAKLEVEEATAAGHDDGIL